MSDIPYRERGYSVEPDTLTVHERYQDHAPRAMRTSAFGVSEYAKGRTPIACETCFPAPKPVKAKEPKGVKPKAEPTPREGMTWVDNADGARWVANEDIEDAPRNAAMVRALIDETQPAEDA